MANTKQKLACGVSVVAEMTFLVIDCELNFLGVRLTERKYGCDVLLVQRRMSTFWTRSISRMFH